ncbi:hypothetical protein GCM10020000_54080 [Streptomyces olivoverticillatus]
MPSTAWAVRFIRAISLVMPRRTRERIAMAITRIKMMRRLLLSQMDQFSSTQPAASPAVRCASSRDEGRGVVVSAARAADQNTAGTLRCGTDPRRGAARGRPTTLTGQGGRSGVVFEMGQVLRVERPGVLQNTCDPLPGDGGAGGGGQGTLA